MRRSGSFPAILAIAGVMALASAVTPAAPAVAAPHRLSAVPSTPIYGFGTNQFGELGNGTSTSTPSLWPTRASGPPGTVSQLSTGFRSSGALMADGTVWTWGSNHYDQLGYDTGGAVVTTPRQVPGLSGITQLALDHEGGLARGSDGSVWAWGNNSDGTLGDGTTTDRWIPQRSQYLSRITQVVAATVASYAVRSDGTLFSWGLNTSGQLGNGTTGGFTTSPAPVPGLPGVTQVASSGVSVLAVDNLAERLWAWGYNGCGELGDGTTTDTDSPELIGMTGVSQVMQGGENLLGVSSAAIRWDGRLWTWGCNGTGWLATGTTAGAVKPTLVTTFTDVSQFAFGSGAALSYGSSSLVVGTLAGTVPSLIGDTQAQASAVLGAVGLGLGTVSYVADYTCTTIGLVRSQSPPAGTSVPPGSAVSVTIWKAPPPPTQCP